MLKKLESVHLLGAGPRTESDGIALIFDLSKYKEVAPLITEEGDIFFHGKPFTFWVNGYFLDVEKVLKELDIRFTDSKRIREALAPGSEQLKSLARQERFRHILNENGEFLSEWDYGFVLPYRIRPEDFQGLVVNLSEPNGEKYIKIAEALARIQNNSATIKAAFCPVYDSRGNLLWPTRMSYEEVKKFTATRDAKQQPKNVAPESEDPSSE